MKCLSQVFQPIITIPKNAKIKSTDITCKSQKLLVECGLVRPTSSGLLALMPLARRALNKLEALARTAIDQVGGQQVSLPSLCAASLWERSGRFSNSAELMTVNDRHGKKYLLAPTHEEGIADLLADVGPLSYKHLPIILYQISSKYRDEARPKHGLLRAREFVMLDAYGTHASEKCAQHTYQKVTEAYRNLFDKLQLPVHRVPAPGGEMGGTESHEWQLCAPGGEDSTLICTSCSHATAINAGVSETDSCAKCSQRLKLTASVEVGHTFVLGSKYSEPLGASYIAPDGSTRPLIMTCYGIGITRLFGASIEAICSDTALRWPTHIAPYHTIIIGPKEGSKEWSGCERQMRLVYDAVTDTGRDVITDDRHHMSIGKRLMQADRMGYPNIIVVGRAALESTPRFELHRCSDQGRDSNPLLLTLDELRECNTSEEEKQTQRNVL